MPRVSVTLPCYNEEDWIAGAIESVLDQSFESFELVVVDDGSTDSTRSVVKSYTEDPRVRIVTKENGGYPSAQSRAFDEAVGDYYAIMEADDLWEADKLERQMQLLETSSASLCHTNAHLIDGRGEVTGVWHSSPPPAYDDRERFMEKLLLNNFICNPSVVVDAEAVGDKRFPDRFTLNSDHFMWLRIAAEHRVGYVPETLTRKRFHGGNISSNYEEIRENRIRLVENVQAYYDYPETVIQRKYASIYLTYGVQLALDGRKREARHAIRRSVSYDGRNLKAYPTYLLTYLGGRGIEPFVKEG